MNIGCDKWGVWSEMAAPSTDHADGPCALGVGPVAARCRTAVVEDEVGAQVPDDALLNGQPRPDLGGRQPGGQQHDDGRRLHQGHRETRQPASDVHPLGAVFFI